MIKLYQQLESVLKVRVNSNEEIIPAIKKLSEMGKFDKPKEIALFAIILDRLGKLEDEALLEQSLKENTTNSVLYTTGSTMAGVDIQLKDEFEETPQTETVENPVESDSIETPPTEKTIPAETPTVTEFTADNITDPQPQDTEPQTT